MAGRIRLQHEAKHLVGRGVEIKHPRVSDWNMVSPVLERLLWSERYNNIRITVMDKRAVPAKPFRDLGGLLGAGGLGSTRYVFTTETTLEEVMNPVLKTADYVVHLSRRVYCRTEEETHPEFTLRVFGPTRGLPHDRACRLVEQYLPLLRTYVE